MRKQRTRGKSQQTIKRAMLLCLEALTLGPRTSRRYSGDDLIDLFDRAGLINTGAAEVKLTRANNLVSICDEVARMSHSWIIATPISNDSIVLSNAFVKSEPDVRHKVQKPTTWTPMSWYISIPAGRMAWARKEAERLR